MRLTLTSERLWRSLAYALFAGLLVVIAVTFLGYGLTWDEEGQRRYGDLVVRWYVSAFQDRSALDYKNLYLYGGFFDAVAQAVTAILPFGVYEDRHLVNAAFGALGVLAAYKLGSRLAGAAGGFFSALFLVLTPVYFGHIFNNPKDVPFAALFAVSLYYIVTSVSAMPRPSMGLVLKLGAALGLTAGIRVAGVVLIGYLAAVWMAWLVLRLASGLLRRQDLLRTAVSLGLTFAITVGVAWAVMLACWPWAQVGPLEHPFQALETTLSFPKDMSVLFDGTLQRSNALPRRYLPTWFAVTLPEFYYVALGLAPVLVMRFWMHRGRLPEYMHQIIQLGVLLLAICYPFGTAILLRPTLYDGLRQVLFVVPLLAVLAGVSVAALFASDVGRASKTVVLGVLLLSTGLTVADMVGLHPYEYVYFNRLVAGGFASGASRFETDYWGLSYREGVEWVESNYGPTASQPIRVGNCSTPLLTSYFLDKPDGSRWLIPAKSTRADDSDVFLAITRWGCDKTTQGKVVHIVERMGVPLLYVFEMDRAGDRRD